MCQAGVLRQPSCSLQPSLTQGKRDLCLGPASAPCLKKVSGTVPLCSPLLPTLPTGCCPGGGKVVGPAGLQEGREAAGGQRGCRSSWNPPAEPGCGALEPSPDTVCRSCSRKCVEHPVGPALHTALGLPVPWACRAGQPSLAQRTQGTAVPLCQPRSQGRGKFAQFGLTPPAQHQGPAGPGALAGRDSTSHVPTSWRSPVPGGKRCRAAPKPPLPCPCLRSPPGAEQGGCQPGPQHGTALPTNHLWAPPTPVPPRRALVRARLPHPGTARPAGARSARGRASPPGPRRCAHRRAACRGTPGLQPSSPAGAG